MSAADSRSFIPQGRDLGLSPDASHRVELAGSLRTLAWPSLCPYCGGAASEQVRVTKIFTRDWRRRRRDVDDVKLFAIYTVDVPFCGACAVRHRQLVQPIGAIRRISSFFSTVFVIPFLIALFGFLLYFLPELLGPARDLVATPKHPAQAASFAFVAVGMALLVRHQTRPRRVPPQTAVTSTFDFSDNLGNIVRGEHRVYAMTLAAYAEAFKTANAHRVWTDADRARGARRERVLAAIVGVLVLVALIVGMLR